MGKRSRFARRHRDYYPTPIAAVQPLAAVVRPGMTFAEPCAGDGALIDGARTVLDATCGYAADVLPRRSDIRWRDALAMTERDVRGCDVILTNPPWHRASLHSMIAHFVTLRSTWLLFDADWPHTRQAAPLWAHCREVVPIGRVKWIPGSKHTGKDNCCWYRFEQETGPAILHGRTL